MFNLVICKLLRVRVLKNSQLQIILYLLTMLRNIVLLRKTVEFHDVRSPIWVWSPLRAWATESPLRVYLPAPHPAYTRSELSVDPIQYTHVFSRPLQIPIFQ